MTELEASELLVPVEVEPLPVSEDPEALLLTVVELSEVEESTEEVELETDVEVGTGCP